ncbi:MAG: polysaccharide biosynthesis/export family protein [Bacteroidota bacterium]|nr:polysaccharide biosynthesis/export family protein [Bacteroidota bacterium]
MKRIFFLFFGALLVLSSCKVFRSNIMLKTPKDYNYDKLLDSLSRADYKLASNDVLSFRVYTNEGFKMVDMATAQTNINFIPTIDARIETDGTSRLPLVGVIPLSGLTVVEAEKLLEDKYAVFYKKPYINLKITNKRVIVFPGQVGSAKVLSITNNNTTILEALALAGGISDDGKAYKIKLIRNTPGMEPKVYLMDLSKIDGLAAGNTQVQAYDLIYVEPRYRAIRTLSNEVAPLLTLMTTFLILYSIITR